MTLSCWLFPAGDRVRCRVVSTDSPKARSFQTHPSRRSRLTGTVVQRTDGRSIRSGGAEAKLGHMTQPPPHTAALLVIGNEILTGKIVDENGPFLLRELRELGVETQRVEVVPDDIELIADAVRRCRQVARYVFTSGGIGPTHDDVTVPAVARALGVPVVRHPEMERLLREHFGDDINEARLRLSDVPEGAELLWGDNGNLRFPALLVSDVLVLPGVPRFFAEQFRAIRERYRAPAIRLINLYLSVGEGSIADALTEATTRYPSLAIGSYPRFDDVDHRVKVTIEGRNQDEVGDCASWLRERFVPRGWIVRESEE